MICEKCGHKNTKDANFCNNCGNNLNGVVNEKNEFKAMFNNIINDIKGVFINPIDTSKKFIKEENYEVSLIYLSINILVIAVLLLLGINTIYGFFNSVTSLNVYNSIYDGMYTPLEIPYFRMFLVVIMTGFIIYSLLAGLIYVVNKYIFKISTSFKKVISWLGINSIFITISSIVIVLCLLISPRLGLIVYVASSILYTYNLYRSLELAVDTDKNKLGYVVMITTLTTLLIVGIILPKIFY